MMMIGNELTPGYKPSQKSLELRAYKAIDSLIALRQPIYIS